VVAKYYGIERKGITVRIEQIRHTIGNISCKFEIQSCADLDKINPWSGIWSTTMLAFRGTFNTTLKARRAQLVFGGDATMKTKFEANWHLLQNNKQILILININTEDNKQLYHR
jgi:hypothetical protein